MRATPRPPKASESISSSSWSAGLVPTALAQLLARPARGLGGLFAHRLGPSADLFARLLDQPFELLQQRVGLPAAALDQVGEIFSASPRVIRPRLTASSTTSWSRSRLRVTLRSRLARNSSTLLSRPVVALAEAFFALVFAAFAFLRPVCALWLFSRRFSFAFLPLAFFLRHLVSSPGRSRVCRDYLTTAPRPFRNSLDRRVVGEPQRKPSRRDLASLRRPRGRRGDHLRPRTSRWSIASGPVGPRRPKRSASSRRPPGSTRAQVEVAAEEERRSPANGSRRGRREHVLGCRRRGVGLRAGWRRRPPQRCGSAPSPGARACPRGSSARAARRSAEGPAARTRVRLEPPSPEAIRSGLRRAAARAGRRGVAGGQDPVGFGPAGLRQRRGEARRALL